MPRPAIQTFTNTRHWQVLVAPVRLEIVEAMRMIAPCSIAELASALDRPADTLYRHIAKLVRAGMVVESGKRRSGRRYEQVYDLVADDFAIAPQGSNGRAANKAFNDTLQSILKIASRTARDSSAAGQFSNEATQRNLIGTIEHAWLTPEEFNEVRDRMRAIKAFMDARKARPATDGASRLYMTVTMALPVTRKRGSQRQESSKTAVKSAAKDAAKQPTAERGSARTRRPQRRAPKS